MTTKYYKHALWQRWEWLHQIWHHENHSPWFEEFFISVDMTHSRGFLFSFPPSLGFSSFSPVLHWPFGALGYKVRRPSETEYTQEHCSCSYHALVHLLSHIYINQTHVWAQLFTENHYFKELTPTYTFT